METVATVEFENGQRAPLDLSDFLGDAPHHFAGFVRLPSQLATNARAGTCKALGLGTDQVRRLALESYSPRDSVAEVY